VLDLHCHILPGVDDGATSLEEALAMARFSVADGIGYIVATPHCHRHLRLLRSDILPQVARLNEALAEAQIPLTVLAGSEIQVTDTAAYRHDYEAGLYCHLGDNPAFTLFELPWKEALCPPDAAELVCWLRDRGTVALLAHPERFDYLQKDFGRLSALVDAGAWLQITVDSLLGNHGAASQAAGETMLRAFPDAVLASDAHSLRRCSGLSAGYAWVREHLGERPELNLRQRSEVILARLLEQGC
jgi:protein-tyrosine phosphatase